MFHRTHRWEGQVADNKSAAGTISYDDFMKVDIRVGTLIEAEPYPEARRPSLKLKIDFGGDIGIKRSAAQITVRPGSTTSC